MDTMTTETQFFNDIISIGGFRFWGKKMETATNGFILAEFDEETGEITDKHLVTKSSIMQAIRSILLGEVQINRNIAMDIWQANKDRDAGYLDPNSVDCIVQVACFGELVYG